MLGLRAKREKDKKIEEAHAANERADRAAAAAAGGCGGEGGEGEGDGGVSILGAGSAGTGRGGRGKRRLAPGEIRVRKDIEELDAGSVAIVEWPDPSNLMIMKVTVRPDSGLWKGGAFEITVEVPPMYPHKPPKCRCETPIYHPNISAEGAVCLNILKEGMENGWRPVYDLNTVIYGVIYLFYEPNANDPNNLEVGRVMREDYARFERNVRESLRGRRVDGRNFPKFI